MVPLGSSKVSEGFYPHWSRQVNLEIRDLWKVYQKDVLGRMIQSSLTTVPKCYHRICTCENPSKRSQSCVTIRSFYYYQLSRYFPRFSDGRRSNTREASLVISRDKIEKLDEPTTPHLGHLNVRSRSRSRSSGGKEGNKVIGSPVRDNKQSKA